MDSKDERSGRSIDPGLRRKISISDDGAPDSVYVDGDLTGKGGSRRKVVIIDEDERSMPAANPAPRRSMDGRVRARRAAVRQPCADPVGARVQADARGPLLAQPNRRPWPATRPL